MEVYGIVPVSAIVPLLPSIVHISALQRVQFFFLSSISLIQRIILVLSLPPDPSLNVTQTRGH